MAKNLFKKCLMEGHVTLQPRASKWPSAASNRLLPLPENTFSFGKTPYSEVSAGIANIGGVLRVDYVWRLSYLKNPGATSWGLRVSAGFGF